MLMMQEKTTQLVWLSHRYCHVEDTQNGPMQGEFSPWTSGTRKKKCLWHRFSLEVLVQHSQIETLFNYNCNSSHIHLNICFVPTYRFLFVIFLLPSNTYPSLMTLVPQSGVTGTKTWSSWSGTNTSLTCCDFQPKPQQRISRINPCPESWSWSAVTHLSSPLPAFLFSESSG